jgi:hypothetical protein
VPLIAISVAAYAAGLILGFAGLHALTACLAFGVAAIAGIKKRPTLIPVARLFVAGDGVATERR